jgi:hypothetical protein
MPTPSSRTLAPGTGLRVLVADDSVSARSILSRVLSRDPFNDEILSQFDCEASLGGTR